MFRKYILEAIVRPFVWHLISMVAMVSVLSSCQTDGSSNIFSLENGKVKIDIHAESAVLWTYTCNGQNRRNFSGPVFELDGKETTGQISNLVIVSEEVIPKQRVREYLVQGSLTQMPDVKLQMIFQIPDDNPIIRFSYHLVSDVPVRMTKMNGKDNIRYLTSDFSDCSDFFEQRLSEFQELPHSYLPSKINITEVDFNNKRNFAGPIFVGANEIYETVLAYEHGSQVPDNYLDFGLQPDKIIKISAVKGNYFNQQTVSASSRFSSPWFIFGVTTRKVQGISVLFRNFILQNMTPNTESREPYIFYNSWNYQERNKNWYGNPYLHEMTQVRMLKEIDIAARMGIDVFVIDAGWFGKTGDWIASKERFPNDLKDIKERMDDHGIKMGLWFNSAAALSSEMLARNMDFIMKVDDRTPDPHEVWETEESYVMCMVSPFSEDYANELIRVAEKYGVRYFKWDAFSQYGCNAPGHYHGDVNTSGIERAENYSFLLPRYMKMVADKICNRFPDAIVDFDITEGERAVGLAFLSSGKYFAINNGPYYYSLDDPEYNPGGGMGSNVLVFPGIARAANARRILKYDQWIPSILFLTHFLPDEPEYSQWINIGSLILGQNGIWGDLLSLSNESIDRFGNTLGKYKQVRQDINLSYPHQTGEIGGSPEIHEKINLETGKGVVVIFYNYKNAWRRSAEKAFPGSFSYVTKSRPSQKFWSNEPVDVLFDENGHAFIQADFKGPGARIVFFGSE